MNTFSDFSFHEEKGVFIVTVNLTRATRKEAGQLNNLLTDAIHSNHIKIIVELNDLEFIDSTFLGVLVWNLKKIIKQNGRFALVGVHDSVQMIIGRTQLFKVFESYYSKEDALMALS